MYNMLGKERFEIKYKLYEMFARIVRLIIFSFNLSFYWGGRGGGWINPVFLFIYLLKIFLLDHTLRPTLVYKKFYYISKKIIFIYENNRKSNKNMRCFCFLFFLSGSFEEIGIFNVF